MKPEEAGPMDLENRALETVKWERFQRKGPEEDWEYI